MDRVRRRIQSSGNCRRTFPGVMLPIYTPPILHPPHPTRSPPPPIFAFKRDCSVLLDADSLSYVNVYCRDRSFDFN